jgi:branched-chain amino acid transport system ATP-binding protein
VNALVVKGVGRDFGGVAALTDVSLEVPVGGRHVIFGPNGAGKTTLFRIISGEMGASAGRIELFGQDVTSTAEWRRARMGVGRTFQVTTLFPQLTVRQSIRLATQARPRDRWVWWRPAGTVAAVERRVEQLIERHELREVAERPVSELSYGAQRILEIVLATAGEPRLLLLDEPAAGLPPAAAERVIEHVAELPRSMTVVLIEHDLDVAFRISDSATVLSCGQVVAHGAIADVRRDEAVQSIYLGEVGDA